MSSPYSGKSSSLSTMTTSFQLMGMHLNVGRDNDYRATDHADYIGAHLYSYHQFWRPPYERQIRFSASRSPNPGTPGLRTGPLIHC